MATRGLERWRIRASLLELSPGNQLRAWKLKRPPGGANVGEIYQKSKASLYTSVQSFVKIEVLLLKVINRKPKMIVNTKTATRERERCRSFLKIGATLWSKHPDTNWGTISRSSSCLGSSFFTFSLGSTWYFALQKYWRIFKLYIFIKYFNHDTMRFFVVEKLNIFWSVS